MTLVGLNVTFMGEMTKDLKKHIATVHCENKFSLLQRKLNNVLLHYAYSNLLDKDVHEITVKQLCNSIGYAGNNHAVIKDALRGLLSTVIEWNVFDEENQSEDWTASAILASVQIKGSLCRYSYSTHMRQLLYFPKKYAKINLITQKKFKSTYGLALYENCVRYKNVFHTRWFTMEEFRKIMGVSKDTYPIFRDFKRRVLDKAVTEVNICSELYVEPEVRRNYCEGKEIRFKIQQREKKKWLGTKHQTEMKEDISKSSSSLSDKLLNDFGLSKIQIGKILKDFSEEFILEKIKLVESSLSYLKGNIPNLASYLLSALNKDYQPPKASKNKALIINKEEEIRKNIAKKTEENVTVLNKKYRKYCLSYVKNVMESFELEKRTILEKNFLDSLTPVLLQMHQGERRGRYIESSFFLDFIKLEHPYILQGSLCIEEYKKSIQAETES